VTDAERLTALQAQAERTAGGLLSVICHTESAQERGRLLSLAFWWAGRSTAYEQEARLAEPGETPEPATARRRR